MSEYYEFFEQLRRGEQKLSNTVIDILHRIPPDSAGGPAQIKRLLRHVGDEISVVLETIENIIRWHGPDEILPGLPEEDLKLLHRLREIAPYEPLEEEPPGADAFGRE